MRAQNLRLILTTKFRLIRFYLEARSALSERDVGNAPIAMAAGCGADSNDPGFRSPRQRIGAITVSVDDQETIWRQRLGQLPFFFKNALYIAKKFQMLPPNAGNHTSVRLDHFKERTQFARMIRAHFEHACSMLSVGLKKR